MELKGNTTHHRKVTLMAVFPLREPVDDEGDNSRGQDMPPYLCFFWHALESSTASPWSLPPRSISICSACSQGSYPTSGKQGMRRAEKHEAWYQL